MEIGFFFKNLITYFIEPFGLILSFFALGILFLFLNKNSLAKIFIAISFCFLLLFSNSAFSNYLIQNLENQYQKYDYKQNIKYIHVLGSGHNNDENQPISSRLDGAGIKRVIEGITIHFKTSNSKLIFTGYGSDSNISSAKMNAKLAMNLGVNKKNIIIGEKPKDTKEEAIFAKNFIGSESFVLVTSATHMPRAMILFKSLGLNPIAAPTSFYKKEINGYLTAPSNDSISRSAIAIHEYLGTLWVKIKSIIN
ncbi:MAG: YdcF family protein [Sulfurimonas sp.]|nr:YdcF family protein [Sulfurimonas sp.]